MQNIEQTNDRAERVTRGSRALRLAGADPLLAVDATLSMMAASAATRIMPFRWTMAAARFVKRPNGRDPTRRIADCVQVVAALKRRLPWRTECMECGLTLHWLLRRRGVGSVLHYGVVTIDGRLNAHVWITVGDRIVLGEAGLAGHRQLLSCPALPA